MVLASCEPLSRRLWGRRPGRPDGLHPHQLSAIPEWYWRSSMDVVVTGRHCELSDRFRSHVTEKLARPEKHDHRIIRVPVEVENERNPRPADRAVRRELTAFSKGPVIRAEAAAEDKMSALDLALDKMAAQMRRAADRRRPHYGRHAPARVGASLPE